uniref:Uncharacterized protein n=1 Tax=Panagrolaimus sp. ES5 TaxID=591445 RepID=A0AC34FEW6_9BILA
MTTKNYNIFSKEKKNVVFDNSLLPNSGTKYNNFNLNQNTQECFGYNSVSLKNARSPLKRNNASKLKDDYGTHYTKDDFKWRDKSNKTFHPSTFELRGDNFQENQKLLKENKRSLTNSSTLSLHIAAYENAVEGCNFDEQNDFQKSINLKQDFINKKWKNAKQLFADTSPNLNVCFKHFY